MSVVKVECHGCHAPYEVEERRIPATGLKMRCPKCGTSLLVSKPGTNMSSADLPAVAKADLPAVAVKPDLPVVKKPGAPPPPPRPAAPKAAAAAPHAPAVTPVAMPTAMPPGAVPPRAAPKAPRASVAMTRPRAPEEALEELDLPAPAAPKGASARAPANPTKRGGVFGEIDLMVDLPTPFEGTDEPDGVFEIEDLPSVPTGMTGKRPPEPESGLPVVAAKKPNPNDFRVTRKHVETDGFGDVDFGTTGRAPKADFEDLPAVPDDAHGRSPFGEIEGFGEVDLPAIHTGQTGPARHTRGAPPEPMRPAVSVTDLPVVGQQRARQESFGEIDLPVIQRGETRPRPEDDDAGLPAPFAVDGPHRDQSFGEIDLPLVGTDLPAPAGGTAPRMQSNPFNFGEAALPTPVTGAGLPTAMPGSALPVAVTGAGLPSPAVGGALPMAVGGSGLPIPAGSALPAVMGGGGLPMPAGSGLPSTVSGGGLPIPATGNALPAVMGGGALPIAVAGGGLPAAMGGGSLPAVVSGGALPSPVHGGGLPATAGYGLPVVSGSGLPVASASLPSARGEADFGELEQDLGALPAAGGANPFDDSDRVAGAAHAAEASGVPSARGQVGDEADIAAPSIEAAPRSRPAPRADDAPLPPTKRAKQLRLIGASVALIGIVGGALSLAPSIGPFGAYFISDKINASANAQQLADLRTRVDAALDEDTAGAVGRALDETKQAHARLPRHGRTAAFAAFVSEMKSLRFGKRGDDDAYAKQALLVAADDPSAEKTLADAAVATYADAARGFDAARAAAQAAPTDLDLASLAGEAAIEAKSKDARDAWKRAVAIKSTARTQYGLARAAMDAGDDVTARDAAMKAIEASKTHAGARILLAQIVWTKSADDATAVTNLKQVTEDPAVRATASDAQLVRAFTWLGRIQLAKSRTSAAERAFGAALKIDPQAVDALIGNGELFYRGSRYSEALARFEAATRADANNNVAKVGVARAYLALERVTQARELLKKVVEGAPKDALAQLWLGRAEEALGHQKDARDAFTKAILVGENSAEAIDAYVALAHNLSTAGKGEEAAAKLAEASAKFPDLPALHRAKGEIALQAGQYEEAKKELEAALEKDDELPIRFHLAVALRRLRRFDEAAKEFDKVEAGDKDYPTLALERGLLFNDMGETDKALAMYNAALEKAPKDVDLKLRVGSTQVIAGHPEQAEPILREVIKERPSSAEVNHFLGRAMLLSGGNQVEAQRFLQKAVDFDGARAEYHLYLGWVANDAGNIGLADMELKHALELDHDLGDAYWQRGILLQKQGQTADALIALTTALQKRPTRYEAYATMAFCYQDLLKWPEAEQAWRKAIAGNDSVPEWHYRLGKLLLLNHGDRAAALAELDKAVLVDDGKRTPSPWVYDAHFLLADGARATDKEKAIQNYQRFLALAPSNDVYRVDAERALKQLAPNAPAPGN